MENLYPIWVWAAFIGLILFSVALDLGLLRKWQSRPGSAPARHPTLRLLSDWLWPHPKAWAGLAAIWIVILAMNLADSDGRRQMANVNPPPSRAMLEALKEQQQMLARIFAPPAPIAAEPPKPSRPSRSEIRPLRRYV